MSPLVRSDEARSVARDSRLEGILTRVRFAPPSSDAVGNLGGCELDHRVRGGADVVDPLDLAAANLKVYS